MTPDLQPIKDVLRSFLLEIEKVEKIRQCVSAPKCAPFNIKDRTPDVKGIEFTTAPDTFWVDDNAYTLNSRQKL